MIWFDLIRFFFPSFGFLVFWKFIQCVWICAIVKLEAFIAPSTILLAVTALGGYRNQNGRMRFDDSEKRPSWPAPAWQDRELAEHTTCMSRVNRGKWRILLRLLSAHYLLPRQTGHFAWSQTSTKAGRTKPPHEPFKQAQDAKQQGDSVDHCQFAYAVCELATSFA